MKPTPVLIAALLVVAFIGANATVNRRSLLDANATTTLKSALTSQNPEQATAAASQVGTQLSAKTAVVDVLTSGSSTAENVPKTLEKVSGIQSDNPGLASQMPKSASDLKNLGITSSDLSSLASSTAGSAGTTAVTTNPSTAQPAVKEVITTVGGAGGANATTGGTTNMTGGTSGMPGAGMGMGMGKRKLLATPILDLYRMALAQAICDNPTSAAGGLQAGVNSVNNDVAFTTLQGLADASTRCCGQAQTAINAAVGIANGMGGAVGNLFIFRLLFAIFRVGLQFCAFPPTFFTMSG